MAETSSLPQADVDELRELAKSSLYFFAKGVLGYDWLVPHIHKPACLALEDDTNTRVGVLFPRGWLKSTIYSISYPLWRGIKRPDHERIMLVQNTFTNACAKLATIGRHVRENALFGALFPELVDRSRKYKWDVDSKCLPRESVHPESTFEAAGTRTKVIGRHYTRIIEDDTVAPDLDELSDEALVPTKDDIDQAIGWHRLAMPLLTNPVTDQILIVGTRWFDSDLISWIWKNEPYYNWIKRACRENALGEPDAQGQVTYPERFSEDVLKQLEVAMGPYLYSCLYLNIPVQSDQMLFRPEWIKYYDVEPRRESLITYTTIDPATDPELSRTGKTDYSVVMTCGKDPVSGYVYVLDYFREKCNPGGLLMAIFDHVRRWSPIKVAYEDIAFQKAMDYLIRERMRKENLYFLLERVEGSNRVKDAKVAGLQPMVASGALLFKTHMKDLVNELLTFPFGAHDDAADALGMQLSLWQTTTGPKKHKPSGPDDNTIEAAIEELRGRRIKDQWNAGMIGDVMTTPQDSTLIANW